MPRIPTTNANAEAAVALFIKDVAGTNYGVDQLWLGVVKLLLTCEVWVDSGWTPHLGQPVFLEKNNYKILKNGEPNLQLRRVTAQGDYIASALGVSIAKLTKSLGRIIQISRGNDQPLSELVSHLTTLSGGKS